MSKDLESLFEVIEGSFTITVNMNDTFYYACADSETLESDDLITILPLITKYGDAALTAYVAIKRGHDPQVTSRLTENFYAAKKELQPMFDSGELDWEEHYDKQERQKEIEKYGSAIEWSHFTNRFRKMLNKDPKWVATIRVAKLADGTFAIGRSTHDAKTRLDRKWERLNGTSSSMRSNNSSKSE